MIVTRYHDISCGHRLVGHKGKCRYLHGHNYRIHFHCAGDVYENGMVIDFSEIKSSLCDWLEENWDHKLLLWDQDTLWSVMGEYLTDAGAIKVSFNPTAENMAQYLLDVIGPKQLPAHVTLEKVVVEETRKCSATAC